MNAIRAAVDALLRRRIRPVINATGIIVHTNLGRSPLGAPAVRAIADVAAAYCTLEYELDSGSRGGRAAYLEHNLAILCGAEAATAVNNCAAALVLALRHFTAQPPRTQVIVSRGELVQIGGGFRVPEVLEASGATLREVGTTNQTTADDYRRAIGPTTAAVLRVHRSNFYMDGFVSSPTTAELAAITRAAGLPLIEDLGSGAIFDTLTLGGNEKEPTPAESLAADADLVCFSGDKLLGGPQAGILAGRREHVANLKREPLFRALRCDKLLLAALEATVDANLRGDIDGVPIRTMMHSTVEQLRLRANRIVASLAAAGVTAKVVDAEAQVGGGSLPRTVLPSVAIELTCKTRQSIEQLADALRRADPPVIGYVADGKLRLDLRTVFPAQDEALQQAIGAT